METNTTMFYRRPWGNGGKEKVTITYAVIWKDGSVIAFHGYDADGYEINDTADRFTNN